MKKTLKQVLVFVAFVATPLVMNAQVNKAESETLLGNLFWQYIPKEFSYDGFSYLYSAKDDSENETTITIYDDDLEVVKSFSVASEYQEWDVFCADFDDNTWLEWVVDVTQTLFNADEKYEYMLPLYDENSNIIGFRIMSEDGTELQSVEFDFSGSGNKKINDDVMVLKINGKHYLVFEGYDDENSFTIFYRIYPQTNEIKAVKSIPASFVGRYTLDGRRQEKMQRGVNIVRQNDGGTKKVLIK